MEKNGIGFIDLLQLALIILKIVGIINWSWWAVLTPYIILFALMVIIGVVSSL